MLEERGIEQPLEELTLGSSVSGSEVPVVEPLQPETPVLGGRPGWTAKLAAAARFGAVGVTGLVVNQLLLWAFVELMHIHYAIAAVLATQGSTTWNFILADEWVFRGLHTRSRLSRFLTFAAINNALLILRLPVLGVLTSVFQIHYLISNFVTLALLFVVRFAVSDRFIWAAAYAGHDAHRGEVTVSPNGNGSRTATRAPTDGTSVSKVVTHLATWEGARGSEGKNGQRRRPTLQHIYNMGGLVSIGSEIRLKELEYFRTSDHWGDLDIEVRVGTVGRRRPRARVVVHQAPGYVSYEEHLGRVGANFQLDIGDRIRVTVGPLLARSPHVLYTNVVEALLRFALISRGRILLHSATVVVDGRGLMLSARTDTGKTGTVLRLLQEQQGAFLSDDMTIVDSTGMAYCYPKPLTISAHTLRAVNRNGLNRRERVALSFQSRIHSREGRSIAQRLADMNLPIMAVNALTQVLIPPPKYMITRLVECEIVPSAQIHELFLIERGPSGLEVVDSERAVEMMIENTDDAYGFPPFRYFAPAIAFGDDDYIALRRKERAILRDALGNVRIRRVSRDDYSWADAIPTLLGTPDPVTEHSQVLGREQSSSVEKWGVVRGNASPE